MKKEKNCEACSDCKKYQDKAFELEVDEELQQERLAKWWKKYSFLVYGGVIAILAVTASAEWYRTHQMKVRLSESDSFEAATLAAHEGKDEEAVGGFEKLAATGKTGYRLLALMNLQQLQMKAGKKEEAMKTMEQLLEATDTKDPLHLATSLSYVAYQMDEGNPDELLKVLNPALENEAFQGLASELAVPLLVKQGKKGEAESLRQKALQNPATSVGSKARLNALKGE